MKMLVVDDEHITCKYLEKTLTKWNYDVAIVNNGEDALDMLRNDESIQIVLLDWMMEGLDGLETCKLIRKKESPYYTYVILLSSKSGQEDIVYGLAAGADDYLIKPCHTGELKLRIQTGERLVKVQQKLVDSHKELFKKAASDSLTGILNRGAIFGRLQEEASRAKRMNQPISIIMCDLDHFKAVNDTYGHLTGDKVLKEIAYNISTLLRPYDVIGRYGGEEFLIVLSGADTNAASIVANRICNAIRSKGIVTSRGVIYITLSLGVATLCSLDENKYKLVQLIQLADNALYKAKINGRDCVEIADGRLPETTIDDKQAVNLWPWYKSTG